MTWALLCLFYFVSENQIQHKYFSNEWIITDKDTVYKPNDLLISYNLLMSLVVLE